jgi:hypothetical protein
MRVRRFAIVPVRTDEINMPQMGFRPELKVICPEIVRSSRASILITAIRIPMHRVVMFSKVKFRVVAVPVSVLELVAGVVKGVGNAAVPAASSVAVHFEGNGVSDPAAVAVGLPLHDGVFPVGLVGDVLFEVDAVVDALWPSVRGMARDHTWQRTYPDV